ncbi:MAG: hypothetical protein HQ472_02815 [Ignavibacteria bacterium]|nr:hypothetical protein [Ignavibacteria bacterium]
MKQNNCTEILQGLRAEVEKSVPDVQEQFRVYQEHCFVARPPEFFALELCGEAGELANLEKKRWKGALPDEQATAFEAADVFIALVNFCNARGINLAQAVSEKLLLIPTSKTKPLEF